MGMGAIRDFFYGGVELEASDAKRKKQKTDDTERREDMKYNRTPYDTANGEYYEENYDRGAQPQPQYGGYYEPQQPAYPRIVPSREVKQPAPLGGLVVFHAHGIEDVQKIIDYLNGGNALVVNFNEVKDLKNGIAQRILDFLSGAIYAIDGTIAELSPFVYTLSPNGVSILNER